MARSSSSMRMPLQPRSTASVNGASSEDSVNRLSTLESSNNMNNKRMAVSASSSLSTSASLLRRGSSSSSLGVEPESSGRSRAFPRTAPSSALSSSSSSSKGAFAPADDQVMIEEKRRKPNGDGFTFHRYLRGKLLGKGGFAKVYMCTALDTNKNYAVKIVPKANLVKARARQKLQTEIKIHRTLKHKYVCAYKHFFEDKANCYILLELCHNQSMNEMIKRRKRLTEPEATFFMQQLIEAVAYMHGNCVIHRDLKLGNLFLDKHLHIKVGDLGLATRLEHVEEKRKTICGTPNYIAPEVIQGNKETRGHSFEVDIWSMGVILYTFLVGKPPYEAKDVKATYQRIIANEYSFPSHVVISEHARSLVESMLQSNPRMRPSLEMIHSHPFFTASDVKIPVALPSNATRLAPQWRLDNSGELVAFQEDENASRVSQKKSLPHGLPPSSRRKPLEERDPNGDPKTESRGRERIDVAGQIRVPSSKSGTGFQIFDESDTGSSKEVRRSRSGSHQLSDGTPSTHPTPGSIDELTSKAAALILESERLTTEHDAMGEGGIKPSTSDTETEMLFAMLARVSAVLATAESRKNELFVPSPRPVSCAGPAVWVSRYVDYTTKYGMGFLLNDGSSGVYFNDSTKAVLEKGGEAFQYIERRKASSSPTETGKRPEPVIETHSLASHPESLQKKVTLLKHFHNYLVEQQKNDNDECGSNVCENPTDVDNQGLPLTYLKKWVRTKHAVLFRLSNQTVQIVFYDRTEVILTPDERYLTYVDKKRHRCSYFLTSELVGSNAELAKRLKYSKEILNTLLSGEKC